MSDCQRTNSERAVTLARRSGPVESRSLRGWCSIALACLATTGHASANQDSPVPLGSPAATTPTGAQVGVNLAPLADWNTQWVFTDALKTSRDWIPQRPNSTNPWDTGEIIQTDELGYPIFSSDNQAVGTLMYRDIAGHYPTGRYTVTWDGDGQVWASFDARITSTAPGRAEFTVDEATSSGILFQITRSNPANPMRNLRVWLPGFEGTDDTPFHPLFLDRLRHFSTIRFMDWQRTNNSPLTSWEERITPDHARQIGPGGVAVEYMVALANELMADPWFCMPHRADDKYVLEFASYVHEHLHPDLTAHVEYSNEVWNGLFTQASWVADRAEANEVTRFVQTAIEARRDFEIWTEVFEGETHRMRRVAAGQAANFGVANQITRELGPQGFDAIAIAAYFSELPADRASFGEHTTADDLIDSCFRDLEEELVTWVSAHASLASDFTLDAGRPIDLISYEGGQHLSANGNANLPYINAITEAQISPRMASAYRRMFEIWQQHTDGPLVAYYSVGRGNKFGHWGHLTHQDQPVSSSPKFAALLAAVLGEPITLDNGFIIQPPNPAGPPGPFDTASGNGDTPIRDHGDNEPNNPFSSSDANGRQPDLDGDNDTSQPEAGQPDPGSPPPDDPGRTAHGSPFGEQSSARNIARVRGSALPGTDGKRSESGSSVRRHGIPPKRRATKTF